MAGAVSAAVFPQQGLLFPGISRSSQVCGTQQQDDASGGPPSVDRLYVTVQFLSNVAHSHSSRYREPVWAQLWHQCCAHLLLPPLSFCGYTISAMLRSTLACILLYVVRIFVLFTFTQASVAGPWTQLLLSLEFYGAPILLSRNHLFSDTRNDRHLAPVDTTVVRTFRSVGNREHVLSGFSARTRTIIRLTRPMRLTRPQVDDLIEIYQGRGFSRRCLVQIAYRL